MKVEDLTELIVFFFAKNCILGFPIERLNCSDLCILVNYFSLKRIYKWSDKKERDTMSMNRTNPNKSEKLTIFHYPPETSGTIPWWYLVHKNLIFHT